ncbi:helix-turn-helix domain-containing protein [Methylobacter svalbardensis]|uniref:helix-turn-helix domain-containing protein n=1 Tax=Methylobacter svalbardensis TaxID=3080016 RepID=UPI0030EC7F81
MPRPYSEDLRLLAANAVDSGKTTREVSALYQVSPAFVSNVHQYWRQTGRIHPKQIGGYRPNHRSVPRRRMPELF